MSVAEEKMGENWDESNLETLSEWIQISTLLIETLDLAIKYYRSIMRKNVLFGLVCSTASGSISITQINSADQTVILSIIFTAMSFSIAIFTGLIKIYQVQERLEEFIQLKQEWIAFSVTITTEIQLPKSQRRDALKIIKEQKSKYLDLLKRDVDIPTAIKSQALKNLYDDKHQYLNRSKKYNELKMQLLYEDDDADGQKTPEIIDGHISIISTIQKGKYLVYNCLTNIYNLVFMNENQQYDGRKTSLSNIILTIMLEEEQTEQNIKISQLRNDIKSKKNSMKLERRLYDDDDDEDTNKVKDMYKFSTDDLQLMDDDEFEIIDV